MAWPSSTRMAVGRRTLDVGRPVHLPSWLPSRRRRDRLPRRAAAGRCSAAGDLRRPPRRFRLAPRSRRDRRSTPTTTRTSACRRTAPASAIGATTASGGLAGPMCWTSHRGRPRAPVARTGAGPVRPVFSPDGQQVAYLRSIAGNRRAARRGCRPTAARRAGQSVPMRPGCRRDRPSATTRSTPDGKAVDRQRRRRDGRRACCRSTASPASDLRQRRAGVPGRTSASHPEIARPGRTRIGVPPAQALRRRRAFRA